MIECNVANCPITGKYKQADMGISIFLWALASPPKGKDSLLDAKAALTFQVLMNKTIRINLLMLSSHHMLINKQIFGGAFALRGEMYASSRNQRALLGRTRMLSHENREKGM